ncbi:MAG: hypothetical protein J7L90_01255, partial [Dehalococcoidia bacterium]|nr:hypothetical protein [Dehalococcoidia bacterium]
WYAAARFDKFYDLSNRAAAYQSNSTHKLGEHKLLTIEFTKKPSGIHAGTSQKQHKPTPAANMLFCLYIPCYKTTEKPFYLPITALDMTSL